MKACKSDEEPLFSTNFDDGWKRLFTKRKANRQKIKISRTKKKRLTYLNLSNQKEKKNRGDVQEKESRMGGLGRRDAIREVILVALVSLLLPSHFRVCSFLPQFFSLFM